MTPINNLLTLVSAAGAELTTVFRALEDKKVTVTEIMAMFGGLMPFAGVDYEAAGKEFAGKDDEANAALVEAINGAITLENKATERKAEAILAMFVYSGGLWAHNETA